MTDQEAKMRLAVSRLDAGISDEYNYASLGVTRLLLEELERVRYERDVARDAFEEAVPFLRAR